MVSRSGYMQHSGFGDKITFLLAIAILKMYDEHSWLDPVS
ncbi:hypothetical protein MCEMSE15_02972 [Fimbriimonadaceae bacterium]